MGLAGHASDLKEISSREDCVLEKLYRSSLHYVLL
jgi:hypothetical protein